MIKEEKELIKLSKAMEDDSSEKSTPLTMLDKEQLEERTVSFPSINNFIDWNDRKEIDISRIIKYCGHRVLSEADLAKMVLSYRSNGVLKDTHYIVVLRSWKVMTVPRLLKRQTWWVREPTMVFTAEITGSLL